MAEFVEVVKQARRMCKSHDDRTCNEFCPLGEANNPDGKKLCEYIGFIDSESAKEIEKRVLAWAKENPELSWKEAWKQLFPDAENAPCPGNCFGIEHYGCSGNCVECLSTPIPAEIAEKLGIKPKEA